MGANRGGGTMKNQEHKLQVACVKWFRLQYPQYANLLFAIPNGGARNAVTGAMLKAEGVTAGVPDLFLAVPKQGFFGLFIEMKVHPNKLTLEQKTMIELLQVQNYCCMVIYTFEQFETMITNYLT
jgi:hypothetical protein